MYFSMKVECSLYSLKCLASSPVCFHTYAAGTFCLKSVNLQLDHQAGFCSNHMMCLFAGCTLYAFSQEVTWRFNIVLVYLKNRCITYNF